MIKEYGKAAVTFVAAVLLVFLYLMIFQFSAQDGESSGGLSYKASETCVTVAYDLSGKHWSDAFRQELVACLEVPIRKMAHFSEYAVMGILLYVMWRPWMHKGKRLYGLVILWVLFSAMGDEIHQTFVPGRCGSVADVFLDTCGGIFGVFFCILSERLKARH